MKKSKNIFIIDSDAESLKLNDNHSEKPKVLYEDISKRGQNTKHFRLGNGNFATVLYNRPIHRLDKKSNLYIDVTPEIEEKNDIFEAITDRFNAKFPKTEGNQNFVSLEKDGREVAWKFIPDQILRIKKSKATFTRRFKENTWDVGNNPRLKYEGMDKNIDLQYEVSNNGIKESIVILKKTKRKTFSFHLKLKGLEPVLSDDKKTVFLVRDDKTQSIGSSEMIIPPAFMEDANKTFCNDLHYEISKTKNGIFLNLVLETDWLAAPDRVYPVIIDPRVELSASAETGVDFVEVRSDDAHVTANRLRVGVDSNGVTHRAFLGFNLPELADGYKITKAGLLLHPKEHVAHDSSDKQYSVIAVKNYQNETLDFDSLNWTKANELYYEKKIDKILANALQCPTEIEIDMTAVVNDWYNDPETLDTPKYVLIKKNDEDALVCNGIIQSTYLDFFSPSEGDEYQPQLYIEYVSTDLYSDHQKFHTFENGRAGTGSINLFTGQMSFAHGDVSAEGVKLPLSVSHLYRFENITKDNDGNIIPSKYGIGWKLSVEQRLDIIQKHGIVAIYTNAQGKKHYFTCDESNPNAEVTDDAGLGLTYREECNCFCGRATAHILTDEKGNKMTFNREGQLIQLIDANGNVSCLNYENNNLVKVVDGSKHSATFHYNAQGNLESIVDNDGRSIQYGYDNNSGNLISITYPSSNEASDTEGPLQTKFFYDNNHRLAKIVDYSGIAYSVEYENDKVCRLYTSGCKSITHNQVSVAENETIDESLSFEYRQASTAIVNDRTGIKTVYKYDINGREISSYVDMSEAKDKSKIGESTPTEIASYSSIVDSVGNNKLGKYRSLSVSFGDTSHKTNLIKNGCFTEKDSDLVPKEWVVYSPRAQYCGFDASYINNKNSYYFVEEKYKYQNYMYQIVDLRDCEFESNVLVASAWAKAVGNVSASAEFSSAKFRLLFQVKYEDGQAEAYCENYDTACEGWQYVAIPIAINKDRRPVEAIIQLDYTANTGTCHFTNVQLVAVDGICTTNTYKTDETPINEIQVFDECIGIKTITTKDDGILKTTDYTDDKSDIVQTSVTDRNGNVYITDYKYDEKHNLIKMQDYRGLVIEYTYNPYGKMLTRKTYHKDDPDRYMFSEYTYEDDNFIKTESDPRYYHNGEKLETTYEYDTSRNLLLNQTAVNGQQYNYSYDDQTDDLLSLSSTTNSKTNENQFFYTCGYLTRVAHNGFNFGFAFDEFGRSKTVSVGDDTETTTLLSTNYSKSGVNDIIETTYASDEKNTVITDILGNPIKSKYTDKNNSERTISNATFDASGRIKKLVDNERRVCYNYTYNLKGNVSQIVETNNTIDAKIIAISSFEFDSDQRLTSKIYSAVDQTYHPIYETTESGYIYPDNEVLGVTLDGKFTDKVTKDGLRRASTKTFQVGSRTLFSESYGYLSTPKDGKTIATEIVSSVASHVCGTSANSSTLNYTYDKAGNLETISNGTSLLSKYYYDGLNRLKREDNHTAGKTYVWDYDVGGNILFKKEYALCTDVNLGTCLDTKTYTYKTEGWRDRLDSFDGQTCTYDLMGNPLTYRGNTLTWTKVRRLASFGANTFEYGASGIRYRKNDTVYTLDGNKILRESDGTKTLTYYHGGSGIVGFEYNGTDYYFRKNLQGDVTEIYTSAGLKVASYVYDVWGKVLSVTDENGNDITDPSHVANLNPIRYRSYYYDVETGLYYLNSRYYDPEVGRFINADTTDVLENAQYDINGLNLYAYCDNNPVAGRDDEGDMSFWKKLAIAAAVVVAVVVVTAAVAAATAATGGAAGAALCAAGTVLVGAAKGALVGAAVGAATGAVVGGVQGAVEGYQETGTLEGTLTGMGKGAVKGAVQGAADGLISGMVSGAFAGAAMSMSGNPMFCFVAGTTVLTILGKKAIETIQVGDTIPCVDHITGEAAEKRVVTTTVNKVTRLIELDIDGEIIQCTETHPFQVKGRGWVEASDLAPNDVVYTKIWNTATVKSVNLLELDEPVEVFNFEVEDCHTYFVGSNHFLVHNGPCTNPNGKKGGTAHQNTIKKETQKLEAAGYKTHTENMVNTPGGYKSKRFTDIMGKKGNREIHIQVGKATKNGMPVARERRALEDLFNAGKDVIFVPYNG